MPKVSVIVPVYNVEQFIRRCIDSILRQTFTDYELFLIDDGSTDSSGLICDAYAEQDKRIRVIHQENQGQAAARNHGVAAANGEWVCFIDSDDEVHAQMLELLYHAITDGHVGISMCSVAEGDSVPESFSSPRGEKYAVHTVDQDYLDMLYDQGGHRCWIVCGKLIRTEIVRNIPFTAGRIYEDNAVACRWLYEAKKVADIDEQLYYYRVNPNGTTKSAFSLKRLDYLWALEEIIKFFKKIRYRRLQKRFCTNYVRAAVSYYWIVRNEFRLSDRQDEIAKGMRRVFWKNMGLIEFPDGYRLQAYDIMFPRVMRFYWMAQEGKRVYRDAGVTGIIEKVRHHLRGRKEK